MSTVRLNEELNSREREREREWVIPPPRSQSNQEIRTVGFAWVIRRLRLRPLHHRLLHRRCHNCRAVGRRGSSPARRIPAVAYCSGACVPLGRHYRRAVRSQGVPAAGASDADGVGQSAVVAPAVAPRACPAAAHQRAVHRDSWGQSCRRAVADGAVRAGRSRRPSVAVVPRRDSSASGEGDSKWLEL